MALQKIEHSGNNGFRIGKGLRQEEFPTTSGMKILIDHDTAQITFHFSSDALASLFHNKLHDYGINTDYKGRAPDWAVSIPSKDAEKLAGIIHFNDSAFDQKVKSAIYEAVASLPFEMALDAKGRNIRTL